ncbi:PREDICTED: histamine H4 receptor isoform X2 [Colobus angolensis palliatus]|uniref:G-protein coupled receptors family 1 profile domain-containing protein n=1 Tax=Colobus angolensis palliatus TaxID=336983 RepID=A0A2K5HHM2_COLAP|nr:PREDICTED: histamine H4 receptor isoform X2 [Colobus angolensis palliatus]
MPDTNSTINLSLSTRITLAFFMSLLAFAIMLGNAVVILAFVVDKNLRHRSSYFFLNLAISDFFVVSESWKDEGSECKPGFFSEWYILAITSFLEFLIPVILVAYFNMNIYWSLWKRDRLSRCQSHPGPTAVSSNICGQSFRRGLSSRGSLSALTEMPMSLHSERQRRKSSLMSSLRTKMNSNRIASKMGSFSQSDSVALHQREHAELLRARRLAKSLAILLGVFAVCWAPYSLFTIVLSFYSSETGPKSVWYRIAFWLQWFNSFVNPLLYPLCHKHFQKAFLKIFFIKKQPLPSPHSRSVSS